MQGTRNWNPHSPLSTHKQTDRHSNAQPNTHSSTHTHTHIDTHTRTPTADISIIQQPQRESQNNIYKSSKGTQTDSMRPTKIPYIYCMCQPTWSTAGCIHRVNQPEKYGKNKATMATWWIIEVNLNWNITQPYMYLDVKVCVCRSVCRSVCVRMYK